ncbi:MAG: hypothetical protein IKB01_10075 [Lachnospiraceae bacterium]|nr:hypothetical protein [Lachnospiraceae bacterium]
MKTKKINIFDSTPRKIKCVENVFDYLGEGTFFKENSLEIGTVYTLEKTEKKAYGEMVHLCEIKNEYGFQDFLFEELKEYELEEYLRKYKAWLDMTLKGLTEG